MTNPYPSTAGEFAAMKPNQNNSYNSGSGATSVSNGNSPNPPPSYVDAVQSQKDEKKPIMYAGIEAKGKLLKRRKSGTLLFLYDKNYYPESLRGHLPYPEYVKLIEELNSILEHHENRPCKHDKALTAATAVGTIFFWPVLFILGIPLGLRYRKREKKRIAAIRKSCEAFNERFPHLEMKVDKHKHVIIEERTPSVTNTQPNSYMATTSATDC